MKYTKSILLYGALIPMAVALGVLVLEGIGARSFLSLRTQRDAMYEESRQKEINCSVLENKLDPHRQEMKYNEALLAGNSQADFSTFLEKELDGSLKTEIAKQSINFPSAITQGEGRDALPYQNLSMTFTGRYDAMQALAMDIETRFPQFKLDAYTITKIAASDPSLPPNIAYRLNFRAITKPRAATQITVQ